MAGHEPEIIAVVKRFFRWVGNTVSTAIAGVITAGIIALILLIKRDWAAGIWDAIVRAWHWLGSPIAIPHWLFIALVVLAVLFGSLLLRRVSVRTRPEVDPEKVAKAEAWRAALAELTDAFLGTRSVLTTFDRPIPLNQQWVTQYRELRLKTKDTYQSVWEDFQSWIRRISPEYLDWWKNEPVWVDQDSGPDNSPEGLVEKLWMPVSLKEALDFWNGWDQSDLQQLAAERIDLVDSFIHRLKHPFTRVESGLEPWHQLNRWARRKWQKLIGK